MAQPTMDDVADRAGVSRALVSLVMRNSPKVSAASRTAVLAAADELGYRPNLMARNLAAKRTMTIGVMVNDLFNPWFAAIAEVVQEAADAAGYRILLGSGRRSPDTEAEAIETFHELRTDGMILLGPRLTAEQIDAAGRDRPVVTVGRPLHSHVVDTVNNDERAGARLLVDHLVGLGHRDIAHIDGGAGAGAGERRQGYLEAMADHGIGARARVEPGGFTESSGEMGAAALLDGPQTPTAIFAANDLMAVGAMDRIEQAGYQIPEDISLAGYDNTEVAALGHVSLTTINQPRPAMGRLALELLVERLTGGRETAAHHILLPSLVVRSTTCPPRRSTSPPR